MLQIKEISPDASGKDLCHPVQKTVQGLGSGIEVSAVYRVLLVDVKPIGREEHGEKEEYKWLEFERFVQSPELALPGWVLHQDDAGAVLSDNVVGIAEREGKKSSTEHEYDEPNVGTIAHCHIGLDVDILAQGDLYRWLGINPNRKGTYGNHMEGLMLGVNEKELTKLPITAPILKIPQNQAK